MIHIDDIWARIKRNPEPQEVTDMRKRIQEAFSSLEFVEGPHKYYRHFDDGSKIELPSVSHTIETFVEPVDWDNICKNKAMKIGVPYEVLKREWRETNLRSTSNGSLTHLFGEALFRMWINGPDDIPEPIKRMQFEDGYLVPYGGKQEAISNFFEALLKNDNVYPILPEAQVFTGLTPEYDFGFYNYAGTFDLLFAHRKKDKTCVPFLADYKTNKALVNDYSRDTGKVMLYPFNNMIEEALSHYTIQMSLYEIALRQIGLEPDNRIILWLKEDASIEKIPVASCVDVCKNHFKSVM